MPKNTQQIWENFKKVFIRFWIDLLWQAEPSSPIAGQTRVFALLNGRVYSKSPDGSVFGPFGAAAIVTEVNLAPSDPGNFTVAHGAGAAPTFVVIEMTSGGQIWFQATRHDATNIYLVASDGGVTGKAQVVNVG